MLSGFEKSILPTFGTPDPADVIDDYYFDGMFNGARSYRNTDGSWYIWYDTSDLEWRVSVLKGDMITDDYWNHGEAPNHPNGDYDPNGDFSERIEIADYV